MCGLQLRSAGNDTPRKVSHCCLLKIAIVKRLKKVAVVLGFRFRKLHSLAIEDTEKTQEGGAKDILSYLNF